MAKLYPPNVEGTIPAFYGTTLVVPFSMNRAVGSSEVKGFSLKMKKVNSSEIILTREADRFDVYYNFKAYFDLTEEEAELYFNIGQYYRVQIAYIDAAGDVGYYSTVGVVKYTAYPTVTIAGLDRVFSNTHVYNYTGVYEQKDDPTEKLYSCRLKLYDSYGILVEDSGDILHSVINDVVPNRAIENFTISKDLGVNEVYKIQLTITTNNGLVVSSPKYRLVQRENTNMRYDVISRMKLKAENNYEQGVISLSMDSTTEIKAISGFFLLSRSEAKLPYEWHPVQKFVMTSEPVGSKILIDYTIEQGKTYIYSLQQYNNYGIYSARLLSNEVWADFEDLFILDKSRQLKIRFNPKVSSMRNNILESKVNTIGSKYPFITRNGIVNHKEFSISGLISYQMDNDRDFMSWEDLGINQNITDLVSENISAERDFKLEVLDWLSNADPKILKSPTEGNYVVKLMGVSLSPNDTVGRMLHTFSCTASEIAPFTYDYLNKLNFFALSEPETTISQWRTLNFAERDSNGELVYKTGELLEQPIYSVRIVDQLPGSQFIINGETIYIGATWAYMAKVTSPIYSLVIPDDAQYTGSMIYEVKDKIITDFDNIRGVQINEIPSRQFIGDSYWTEGSINIIDVINDIKTQIIETPFVRFEKRGVHKLFLYRNEGTTVSTGRKFYSAGDGTGTKVDLTKLDKLALYKIYWSPLGCDQFDKDGEIYYRYNGVEFNPYTEMYYDPISNKIIEDSYDIFDVYINNPWEAINLEETEDYTLSDVELEYLRIGDGIIADMTIVVQVIDYGYEFGTSSVIPWRKQYDSLLENYWDYIEGKKNTNSTSAYLLEQLKSCYKHLISAIEIAMIEDQTRG